MPTVKAFTILDLPPSSATHGALVGIVAGKGLRPHH